MAFGFEIVVILGLLSVSPLYYIYSFGNSGYRSSDVDKPIPPLPVLCYFALDGDWPNNGTLHPALQNASLCSHIIFLPTTAKDCQIYINQADIEKYLNKIPLLRKQNPNLKMLISSSIGGNQFAQIMISEHNRTRQCLIFNQYIQVCSEYNTIHAKVRLDMDWEFPGWQLPFGQRANFTLILQELRKLFDNEAKTTGKHYTISAAVAAGRSVMVIYNVTALAKSLDFVNLMVYDMHAYSTLDCVTDYNSPLYPTDWQKHVVITAGDVGWSSNEWEKRGMPKSKIVVGIPTYGHAWTLEKAKYHGLYAPAIAVGRDCDECTYPWTCDFITSGATVVWDEDAAVPYAYKGDQWISYDNVRSLEGKAQWIQDNGFGGIMVYSLNSDDYYGTCNEGKFPLMSAINKVLSNRK